ncbi:hypothetical protein DPMN_157144 [Dreissena polymorpha]|uniref:PARP catalytic domain-containing protein n=1 Tax=Dreissena polymorpha TaxID=45954 RepID=A0A9D4EJW4_DREPO|nr:hypothetical protein DPMN_157144 [Dreissena polymorpha]
MYPRSVICDSEESVYADAKSDIRAASDIESDECEEENDDYYQLHIVKLSQEKQLPFMNTPHQFLLYTYLVPHIVKLSQEKQLPFMNTPQLALLISSVTLSYVVKISQEKQLPSHIVKLPQEKQLPFMKTQHQFLLISSPPAKKMVFHEAKKQYDSTFAFHGSAIENWHSIIRQGLINASGTKFQVNGAAYGQ